MYFTHEKIRIAGILLFLAGLLCLPFPRTNPKQALSIFEAFASLGLLAKFGLVAMVLGAVIFATTFFIKR